MGVKCFCQHVAVLFSQVFMAKNRMKNKKNNEKVNINLKSSRSSDASLAEEPSSNFSASIKEVIHEGLLVLGCIQEIESHRLIFAIPGGLGIVDIFHISKAYNEQIKLLLDGKDDAILSLPSLSDMFEVGDVLCCKVIKKCPNNSIHPFVLTIDPKIVNGNVVLSRLQNDLVLNCYIELIDEDSVTINAGCDGTKKVLTHEHFDQFFENRKKKQMHIGQVLRCVVTSLKDRYQHAVYEVMMTVNPGKVIAAELQINKNLSLNPPGCKFTAEIAELLPTSVTLMARGSDCKVVVPRLHLAKRWDKINENNYKPVTKVEARILLYHSESKTLFASLQTRLVGKYSKPSLAKVTKDSVIEKAKVAGADQDVVIWKFNKNIRGISKPSEEQFGKINALKFGSEHRCRILYANSMDDVVALGWAQDLITYHDLKCGDLVRGTIVELNKIACVRISKNVVGIIDGKQLINSPVAPELRQKITCRVLSVYPDEESVFLACNPKMVESKLPIIDSYENVKRGQNTHGTVIGFQNQRVAVMLYNNIRAEVDVTNVIDPPEKSVTCFFRIGDVVRCTVESVDKWRQQLHLSIQGSNTFVDRTGEIHECKVTRVDENGLQVQLTTFGNIQNHILPVMHLSDQSHLCEVLRKTYKVGDVIPKVVFISKGVVSRKMSLIHWYETNTEKICYEGFHIGRVYPAFTGRLSEGIGLFVSLPGGFVGFNNKIRHATGNESICLENATVFVKVNTLGLGSHHVIYDVQSKLELPEDDKMVYSRSFVQDLHRTSAQIFGKMKIGDEVMFEATSKKVDLVLGKVDGRNALLYKNHIGHQIQVGESYKAVVIHLDPANGHVEVTLNSEIICLLSSQSTIAIPKFSSQVCTCLLVKNEFVLAVVNGNYSPKFVYIPGVKYGNTTFVGGVDCAVGSKLDVTIKIVKKQYSIGVTSAPADDVTLDVTQNRKTVKRKMSNGTDDQLDFSRKRKLCGAS